MYKEIWIEKYDEAVAELMEDLQISEEKALKILERNLDKNPGCIWEISGIEDYKNEKRRYAGLT